MTAREPVADLRFGELAVLAPLAVLMLVMGVVPNYWLQRHPDRSSTASDRRIARRCDRHQARTHADPYRNAAEAQR